jgi:hypothetical protein
MKYLNDRVFVLGARDAEMERIEALLTRTGYIAVFAVQKGGARVSPSTAYKSVGTVPEIIWDGVKEVILVECDAPVPTDILVRRCDHHRQGDPGFDREPVEFWLGSSLGQVHAMLGVEPDRDAVLAAAADHCLAAAYAGACPGVTRDEMLNFRVSDRAKFQGVGEGELKDRILAAVAELKIAPVAIDLGIKDLRGKEVPELPEAACLIGVPCLATVTDADGRVRVVLKSASPALVRKFMETWAPAQGITEIYGFPVRGMAGGFAAS